jgi:tryptophanyl-tRNA synthetase
VFVVPQATLPTVGARIKDLQDPTRKMSKSEESPQGTILLLDDPADIERKIKRAVTDNETEVRYDPEGKPGVSNLLTMLAAVTNRTPDEVAAGYHQYGPLKADTAEAVVEHLRPIQKRYQELVDDPGGTAETLHKGAEKARSVAAATLARAQDAVGLVPRA